MIVELSIESEADVPTEIPIEYVGQTADGADAVIISGVWAAFEQPANSVHLELADGTEHEIRNATLIKSGDAAGALDIPGAELHPAGTVSAGSNEHAALQALRQYQNETGVSYGTPSDVVPFAAIDEAAIRNAFGVLFGIKRLLSRRPAGTGPGGVQFAFTLTAAAEAELDRLVENASTGVEP